MFAASFSKFSFPARIQGFSHTCCCAGVAFPCPLCSPSLSDVACLGQRTFQVASRAAEQRQLVWDALRAQALASAEAGTATLGQVHTLVLDTALLSWNAAVAGRVGQGPACPRLRRPLLLLPPGRYLLLELPDLVPLVGAGKGLHGDCARCKRRAHRIGVHASLRRCRRAQCQDAHGSSGGASPQPRAAPAHEPGRSHFPQAAPTVARKASQKHSRNHNCSRRAAPRAAGGLVL